MKLRLLLPAATLIAVLGMQVSAIELDELIHKCYEARGGLKKIQSVDTRRTFGTMFMQGAELDFETYHKRPMMMRVESSVQGQKIIQAYDGEMAWGIFPMAGSTDPRKIPAEQAQEMKQQADFDGFLVDYEAKGYQIELVGKEELEGTEVYLLRVTYAEDRSIDVYIDAEHFLEIMWTTKSGVPGQEFEVNTYWGDYKEVDGLMFAHSLEGRVDGQVVNQITLDSVVLNVEIDDGLFEMPGGNEKQEAPAKDEDSNE